MIRREIVEKTIKDKDTTKIPYHIAFFSVMEKRIKEYFGTDNIDAALGNYIKWLGIKVPWKKLGNNLEEDPFGVVWHTNPFNRGNVAESPLKEPDLKKVRIPDYPYEKILKDLPEQLERDKEYYHIIWVGDLFERAHMLRGTEECLMDFYLNKTFIMGLLEILTELILKNIKAVQNLDISGVFLSDDYGSQHSLLISKEMWREFIKPWLKKIVDYAHECGKDLFLHSDGNVEELIPEFIELGVDVLHPVQSEIMDFQGLKRKYGKEICFYGGIGTQSTILTNPQCVKEEVERLISLKDSPNSFILAPTLQLMEDVPFENILALIDGAKNV